MPAKRAKKKTARKRAAKKKAAPKKKPSAKKKNWLLRIGIVLLALVAIIAGVYYFGSFELRAKMDRVAVSTINSLRTHGKTPGFVSAILDKAYDAIPSSSGLIVEGSELGRDPEIPFIAGIPNSRFPVQTLRQPSYVNLFNQRSKQTACIAIRLDNTDSQTGDTAESIVVDSRIPYLSVESMTLGQWNPHSIAPSAALTREHGERGANDAQLATNHAPMTDAFSTGVWEKAMRELTLRYPKRFDEVWIYIGPLYRPESSKLASGIAIPDAFYAITFDLTDEGGLRALALIIPMDAEDLDLNSYLTSISQIEKLSGLQFLPELDLSLRDTLIEYISPTVW